MDKRRMIDLNLNLTKLGEAKQYYKEGKKGVYIDLRVIEMENKQYNDMMIVVKVPKEEYDKGVRGEIIGYAKDWDLHNDNNKGASGNAEATVKINSEDLPF